MTPSERLWASTTGHPYPAPGDPHAVSALASTFLDYRDRAQTTYSLLDGIGRSNGSWEGDAAREFHSSLTRTLPNLSKAIDSFTGAGDAARVFASGLTGLQAQADALRPRLESAEASVQALQWSRLSPDPAERARYDQAWYARQPLLQQLAELTAQYDEIVRVCAAALRDASDAGIRNSWKTWAAGHRDELEKISEVSGAIADVAGSLQFLATITGQPELVAIFGAVQVTFTAVKFVADIGLASAEYTTSGCVSAGTAVDLAEDGTSMAFFAFPRMNPSGKLADYVARGPLTEQRTIANIAFEARDMDGYEAAAANVARVELGKQVFEQGVDGGEGLAWQGAGAVAGWIDGRRMRVRR